MTVVNYKRNVEGQCQSKTNQFAKDDVMTIKKPYRYWGLRSRSDEYLIGGSEFVIPYRYRTYLNLNDFFYLIIIPFDDHLRIFPVGSNNEQMEFNKIKADLMLEGTEVEIRLGKADIVSVDFNYIISISDSLLRMVDLENRMVVIGMRDWFELWPYKRWLEERRKLDNRF